MSDLKQLVIENGLNHSDCQKILGLSPYKWRKLYDGVKPITKTQLDKLKRSPGISRAQVMEELEIEETKTSNAIDNVKDLSVQLFDHTIDNDVPFVVRQAIAVILMLQIKGVEGEQLKDLCTHKFAIKPAVFELAKEKLQSFV